MKRQFDIQFIVDAVQGKLLSQVYDSFIGVGTDTRKDLSNQLFIALKGPSFDAHDFLSDAVKNGAKALIVDRPPTDQQILEQATVIQVNDTLLALQSLGRQVRRSVKAQVLAITGSNGKTSVKEFAAQIIGRNKRVHYNQGSFNNHWGVPLTLLEVADDSEIILTEMGMNHAHEIEELMGIAEPDVVLCTTVGQAHIENFANMEELAKAKSEIYRFSKPDAVGIFNLDNHHTALMHKAWSEERGSERLISYSMNSELEANIQFQVDRMEEDSITLTGQIQDFQDSSRSASFKNLKIPVFGEHNVSNLMAASALALASGLSPDQIVKALPHCHTIWGRNQSVNLRSGARVIFDGYNANPDSMKALLTNLKKLSLKGRRFGVFGEMLEMGAQSASLHEELAYEVAQCGFEYVWFVGRQKEAFERGLKRGGFLKSSVFSEAYEESIASALRTMLETEDVVLIKGSRGIRLEQVVFALEPIDFAKKA